MKLPLACPAYNGGGPVAVTANRCWAHWVNQFGKEFACYTEVDPADDLGLCADHIAYFREGA